MRGKQGYSEFRGGTWTVLTHKTNLSPENIGNMNLIQRKRHTAVEGETPGLELLTRTQGQLLCALGPKSPRNLPPSTL